VSASDRSWRTRPRGQGGCPAKTPLRNPAQELGIDIADGEVHLGELPHGLIALLPVNGDIPDDSPVFRDEFFAHHEHSTASASGVAHPSPVRFDHLKREFWGVGERDITV
jgi:hypothetical protein